MAQGRLFLMGSGGNQPWFPESNKQISVGKATRSRATHLSGQWIL